ncbi:hypothetical protein IQ07DRAFT_305265 [Pyrenochaeta sp. DS3sAY3a]|nr:hypothetical protein IQ07DRAFT_305265 [Pyrenochaeta sp. DS3sAY3a]
MRPVTLFARFTCFPSSLARQSFSRRIHLYPSSSVTTQLLAHYIYPHWSLARTMSTSVHSGIRESLALMPGTKWGWVIYRCSYSDADNETWAQFRSRVEASSREDIAQSDAPEIAQSLEWTWVEDQATLEGASTAALRKRFRAWAADQVAQQPINYEPSSVSRYKYFIKIDKEVLQNLAAFLEDGWSRDEFVKIVDAYWEPDGEPDEERDVLAPIDGCTERDVGWMRIGPHLLNAEFYDALDGDEMAWEDQFYTRPPSILHW